jgi:hypothetical protein
MGSIHISQIDPAVQLKLVELAWQNASLNSGRRSISDFKKQLHELVEAVTTARGPGE